MREEDTLGYRENAQLLTLLEPLRLTIKDIPPDGNWYGWLLTGLTSYRNTSPCDNNSNMSYCCLVFSSLYAAFSDQLSLVLGHKVLIID